MGERIEVQTIRKCDFCGKDEQVVAYLIVSPNHQVDICDECVDVCADLVAAKRAARLNPPAPPDTDNTKSA